MAVKGYFLDNESYSADDVNKAFSYLTTEGVSLFSDTGTVNSDLDTALADLTGEGVDIYNLDSCKVYKSGDVYMVKKGVCFLSDGAFVVVDDEGYELEVTEGVQNYVYVMHDALKNKCTIYVSVEEIPEGAVALAEIDEEGKITDKRTFSKAKVAVPTANITGTKTVSLMLPDGTTKSEWTYCDYTFDIGFGGYNYVRTKYQGKTIFAYIGSGEKTFFIDETSAELWVKKEGSSLIITAGTWSLNPPRTISIEMFFF